MASPPEPPDKIPDKSKAELRREREARALRENLRRRKAQDRARQATQQNPPRSEEESGGDA